MIDWATVILQCRHSRSDVDAGIDLTINPDGSIVRSRERALQLRGSWEASTVVRSHFPDQPWGKAPVVPGPQPIRIHAERDWLMIDGNPSKWRWGHNLFGTDDPGLISWWVEDICSRLRIVPTLHTARLTRIDLTRSFQLDDDDEVSRWLRVAERTVSMKYRGRGNIGRGSTLYWGKHSRRSAVKAYSKSKELIDHPLPDDLENREKLREWACGKLRIEVCLRSMHLKNADLSELSSWTEQVALEQWNQSYRKLNMTQKRDLDLSSVSRPAQGTFAMWQSGMDVQGIIPRATWYRHRRELLGIGIDISIPHVDSTERVSVIQARPALVPSWASDPRFLLAA